MLADTPLPRGFGAALASVDTFFPRAPEQFVTSPLCLVGYVRWDARSDRVPPLQTIIFSSFTGRTKGCRSLGQNYWICCASMNGECQVAKCMSSGPKGHMRALGTGRRFPGGIIAATYASCSRHEARALRNSRAAGRGRDGRGLSCARLPTGPGVRSQDPAATLGG